MPLLIRSSAWKEPVLHSWERGNCHRAVTGTSMLARLPDFANWWASRCYPELPVPGQGRNCTFGDHHYFSHRRTGVADRYFDQIQDVFRSRRRATFSPKKAGSNRKIKVCRDCLDFCRCPFLSGSTSDLPSTDNPPYSFLHLCFGYHPGGGNMDPPQRAKMIDRCGHIYSDFKEY